MISDAICDWSISKQLLEKNDCDWSIGQVWRGYFVISLKFEVHDFIEN